MNIRRFAIIGCLGLATVLSGAYVTKAQSVVFEPGNYRINYRGYRTNERGARLLQQAVNRGYADGYRAGQEDRDSRRRLNWRRNEMYRNGTTGYENYVGQSYYRYYYQ